MKITIKGEGNAPVKSETFKAIIDRLNETFAPMGLKVRNMTCYIRFMDEFGRTKQIVIIREGPSILTKEIDRFIPNTIVKYDQTMINEGRKWISFTDNRLACESSAAWGYPEQRSI